MRIYIEAWPNLTSLNLTTYDLASIDFDALIEIAKSLPLLRYLALQINATDLHDIPLFPFPHHLQCLDVMNSSLRDPAVFARLVETIFP
jgi:hypothetical protein